MSSPGECPRGEDPWIRTLERWELLRARTKVMRQRYREKIVVEAVGHEGAYLVAVAIVRSDTARPVVQAIHRTLLGALDLVLAEFGEGFAAFGMSLPVEGE